MPASGLYTESFMPSRLFWRIIILPLGLSFLLTALPAQESEALCVQAKRANLRKGPGVKFEKTWEVLKYMPFRKIGQKGAWYRIKDVDGDVYWAHRKLFTTRYKCAVIKQNKTNVRTGPGSKHKTVRWSPVDKYFSMKVLKIKKNWVHIVDAAGDKAWIYRPLLWIQ